MEPVVEKVHISLPMPRDLYDRLNNMRWDTRARSFAGLIRYLLEKGVDRHEDENLTQPPTVQ